MFLRRLHTSAAALRRRAADAGVVAALRAEILHELNCPPPPPSDHSQVPCGFAAVLDAPRDQAVLLRRLHRDGEREEEVLVSALLAPLRFRGGDALPRDALMKVFVRRPHAKPVLRFDCRVWAPQSVEHLAGSAGAGFDVTAVCYHPFDGYAGDDKYEGPKYSSLDLKLQAALKEYIVGRSINSELTSWLLQYLLRKEQTQYVSWLSTLWRIFAEEE